ncbi:hypothetical protein [Patulibacter sp.]|uniref:hypothetical protein n=1 Tax=Patulibacter sp. TaxID=1912859 RepID=UPI002724280D|nr:hypothetical protein [Patulibacter sp.]MDO9407519.1 hypothetical protein [Patulibacter sp.]
MTTDDAARSADIEGRVADWVQSTLGAAGTTGQVEVSASAKRAVSLPDDGLEVRPEDWTVTVALRFAEADRAASDDALATLVDATGTVTLDERDAAELTGPSEVERADGSSDGPFETTVTVQVTVPWPNRNDAAAESA